MNPHLPDEAADFGAAAEKAFTARGGVDLARLAEADRTVREREVDPILRSLGADDLDPSEDLDTAAAAGELCRSAGRVALPYPVVPAVLRDRDRRPTAAVASGSMMVDHGDLFSEWRLVRFDGSSVIAKPGSGPIGSRLGPFVCDLDAENTAVDAEPAAADVPAMFVTLSAWKVLGCVERALDLAVAHVRDREQFGQKLSEFQAVQFQLADAAVAVAGLGELCRYTIWKAWADATAFTADALALRLYALETARTVLRTAQQLHGAAGVCDEYDVSILARHIQPDLRLPCGESATASQLVAAVDHQGFDSLFPHGGTDR